MLLSHILYRIQAYITVLIVKHIPLTGYFKVNFQLVIQIFLILCFRVHGTLTQRRESCAAGTRNGDGCYANQRQ